MGTISKWYSQTKRRVSTSTDKQLTGTRGEAQALAFLQQQGLVLLTQNYRSKLGEIDLIMRQKETLVFVEVRSRKNAGQVSPLQSITPQKQRRIINTAEIYLQRHYKHYPPCRFDAVCITGGKLEWIPNAFP